MKQKQWRIVILIALLAVTAALLAFAFWPEPEADTTVPPASVTSVTSAAPAYFLKSYQGKVAAFESGNSEPIEILDVRTEDLPQGDQKQLDSQGIPAKDREALRRLIEDYGG